MITVTPHKVTIVESLDGRAFQTYYCKSEAQAVDLSFKLGKSLDRMRFMIKVVPTDPRECVP